MKKSKTEKPGALITRTLKLLHDTRHPTFIISIKTGVSYHWIQKFAAKKISNPSVNRVERLYNFLAARKLKV